METKLFSILVIHQRKILKLHINRNLPWYTVRKSNEGTLRGAFLMQKFK
uniref:Uncharacterized protein n=1 Tax=Siphoviridae sp. ctuy39 TaxID=2825719 RepID=A0A8S5VEA3_9CAUD|nr:MAG TPA: hypothetical protein [Siphoviridae sp. ctuy39]